MTPGPTVTVRMKENERAVPSTQDGSVAFSYALILVLTFEEASVNQSFNNNRSNVCVAFVQARWHSAIVDECRFAFIEEIERATSGSAVVEVFDVPGAFEIPLMARTLAKTGKYDAVVGSAFVVDGGIYRHDFVADAVLSGLMQAQMDTDVPVLSAVLTPHQFQETEEHTRFFREHFKIKGREAAVACLSILELRRECVA